MKLVDIIDDLTIEHGIDLSSDSPDARRRVQVNVDDTGRLYDVQHISVQEDGTVVLSIIE